MNLVSLLLVASLVPTVKIDGRWLSSGEAAARGLILTEERTDAGRRVTLENRTPAKIRPEELGWAKVGEDDFDGPGLKVYVESWQMASPCGVRSWDDPPFDYSSGYLHNCVSTPSDFHPGEKGRFLSDGQLTLRRADGRLRLYGFTTGRERFGHFDIRLTKDGVRHLRVLCACDRAEIRPGGRITTENLIEIEDDDSERLFSAYADRWAADSNARRRFAPPIGWCSWYYYFENISLASVIENMDWFAAHRKDGFDAVEYIQLDDGYEIALGDWFETNERFPGGLERFAQEVKARGFKPALWVGPFMVEENAKLLMDHPDWIVKGGDGRPYSPLSWRENHKVYSLDGTHPAVQDHLRKTFRRLRELGIDYVKLDFCMIASSIPNARYFDPAATRAQALRRAFEAIREGFGEDGFILGCTAPFAQLVGIVDAMRVSTDITPYWDHAEKAHIHAEAPTVPNVCRNIINHSYLNGRLWINDPDTLIVRDDSTELTEGEVRLWAEAISLTGGSLMLSDRFSTLSPKRLPLVKEVLRRVNRAPAAFPADRWERAFPSVWEDANGLRTRFNFENDPMSIDGTVVPAHRVVGPNEPPRWLNVAPLGGAEGDAEAAADAKFLAQKTPIDAMAYSMALFPEGKPLADKASAFVKDFVRRRAAVAKEVPSLRQGILFQATMGHGWTPNVPAEGQLVVRKDGSTLYKFCPFAPAFRKYMREQARTLGAANPDFFMIDDDTRLNSWVDGCYCPLHLDAISQRTGRCWTREALVEAIEKDPALAREWDKVLEDSIAGFLEIVRAEIPAHIPGEFCLCEQDAHQALRMAKILAAPGQKPVIRLNNSSYLTGDLRCPPARLALTAREIAAIGEDEAVFLDEPDTCPQNRYSSSATFFTHHILSGLFEGCRGAKVWITRMGNRYEKESARAYRAAFAEWSGMMKTLSVTDFRRTGVVCPVPAKWPAGVKPGRPEDWGSDQLAFLGIPWRTGIVREGEIAALRGFDVAYFGDDELKKILSGRVLLDGSAALALTARGFGSLIGVEAKPWSGKSISGERFGQLLHQGGYGKSVDLSAHDPKARVESMFVHKRSAVDVDEEVLAPGSLSFTNAKGGRVWIMAAPVPKAPIWFDSFAYFTETRKREIVRALEFLGGPLPLYYAGDAEILLETAVTPDGATLVFADNLNLDTLESLPLVMARSPKSIESLGKDGKWRPVTFGRAAGKTLVAVKLETFRPVILRVR